MNSVKINDIPKFMSLLFSSECFDDFYVSEALIQTFVTYKIDGYTNKDFLDSEEVFEQFARWKRLRPIAKELIKGKKIPVSMKFTLILDEKRRDSFFGSGTDGIRYLINVRFENGTLHLISATTTETFLLDKSFEKSWDEIFVKYVASLGLSYENEL